MTSPGNAQETQYVRERYKDADLEEVIAQLEKEKTQLQTRLDFVEDLVGPTEAQRKNFQQQLIAARSAALCASRSGIPIPTRFVGRINEKWLRSKGISERDCALLQRGCITGPDGIPKDISLLGDPKFRPYDDHLQPLWDVRGGSLNMSLRDVRDRWEEDVALEVMQCAIELDKYDSSRRLGLELPWLQRESRELQASEIIRIMERELTKSDLAYHTDCDSRSNSARSDAGLNSVDSPSPDLDVISIEGSTRQEDVSSPIMSLLDAVVSPGHPQQATSPVTAPNGCDDEHEFHERYEWSLADADIEQLLQGGKADQSRSFLSSTRVSFEEGTGEVSELERDEEEEALLELLEEEITGSLGLWSTSPDMSIGSPL